MVDQKAPSPLGPWAAAQHLGYVVVYADAPGGHIDGFACSTIMNHRQAHKKKRELEARGWSGLRIAIVRGLTR